MTKWIWTAKKLPEFNQFVFFKKEFTLNAKFEAMHCLITAERFFQLWINGEWVNQGPALGLPEEKSFDVYDINHLLKPGENVIAVLVNFDRDTIIGENHTNWFIPKTRAGLLCQIEGNVDNVPFKLITDETWVTRPACGWDPEAPFLNDMYHQEHYSFGKDPADWHHADSSTDGWQPAVVLGDAAGNGIDGNTLPWLKLVKRDIPLLNRKKQLPVHIQAGEIIEQFDGPDIGLRMTLEAIIPLIKASIDDECNLLVSGDKICTLRNSDLQESEDTWDGNHVPTLILDFGELCNAHLVIEAKGPSGANLHIGYGPNLVEGRVFPYRSTRTSWADSIELDGTGWNRWRSYHWRQFRYVQITQRACAEPVYLRLVNAERIGQGWQTTTSFLCSDPQLQNFWEAACNTAETCTIDLFMDNASREGRQYAGDVSNLAQATAAIHGDAPIIRRYLRTLTQSQRANGLYQDSCPGKGNTISAAFDHGFSHVEQIWKQFIIFGDKSILSYHWESIQKFLALWDGLINQRGLLEVEKFFKVTESSFFPWFDWAYLDRCGEMLLLNAMYMMNLDVGARISRILEKDREANDYDGRYNRIGKLLKSEFWDEERGLFVDNLLDGEKSKNTSEHSQGIMLYLGLVTREQAYRIVREWKRAPEKLSKATINFLYRILEGLIRFGYYQFAVDILRNRLSRHLFSENNTFGEVWAIKGRKDAEGWVTVPSRATSQGGGAWPAMFLLEHVAGLQLRFGSHGCIRLAPQPAISSSVEVNWCGNELIWKLSTKVFHLTARFPQFTPVEFILPFAPERVQTILVNGRELPVKQRNMFRDCKGLEVQIVLNADVEDEQ